MIIFFFLFIISLGAQEGQLEILSAEIQINTAVLPAPEEDKSGAMV